MQWYAIVNAQGVAVSFGTVVADPLPAGLTAIEIDHAPGAGERWDEETQSVIPAVAVAVEPLSARAPLFIFPVV